MLLLSAKKSLSLRAHGDLPSVGILGFYVVIKFVWLWFYIHSDDSEI